MNKIGYLIFLNCLLIVSAYSQQLPGICGTTSYENNLIKQRMLENREEWKNKVLERGGAQLYVPVTYWAVAQDAGTGRIPYISIINNLCCLNKIYSGYGITFYLKVINDWNNTSVYDNPSNTLGRAYIGQKMQSNLNALNIFVTDGVNPGQTKGEVLAFYSPDGDYMVCGKKNMNGNCQDMAHEIGHFFSLAHTFNGWEEFDYNDLTMTCVKPTPVVLPNGALVEYVDRNKPGTIPSKKNCEEAADGFCDTPADYDLGFGWNGNCNYTGCTKDPDGILLDPMETNFMGYFLNCLKEFTVEQVAAITKDLLSNKRNFLRKVNYTPKPDVIDAATYLSPTTGSPALGYDSIKFSWNAVPNAEYYLLDLSQTLAFGTNLYTFITKRTDTILTNFKPGIAYFWRVTPFNSNSFCIVPKITNFRAPAWTVASENIENDGISSYVFQSNERESTLIINSTQQQFVTIQIVNPNGQILSTQDEQLIAGENKIQIDHLSSGFYFYRILSDNRKQNTGKFIKL